MVERRELIEEGGEVFGVEAVLGVFGGELDLDEDGDGFVERGGGAVETLGGLEGVECVDGVEELGGLGGFVVLEGADEVHLDVSGGDYGLFRLPLLDAVFAEEALAGGVGFEDGLGRVHLADGHEGDGAGRAVGPGAGVGDLVADALEVGGDGHPRQFTRSTTPPMRTRRLSS